MSEPVWTVDALDLRVAQRLCRLAGADDPTMVTLAALAASAPRGGHVCVDLTTVAGDIVVQRPSPTGSWRERPEPEPLAPLGDVEDLLARAASSPLARRGDEHDPTTGATRATPLVVDGDRVYLDRYWDYEDRLHTELVTRSAPAEAAAPASAGRAGGAPPDPEVVRSVLDRVAPHDDSDGSDGRDGSGGSGGTGGTGGTVDRQRLAVANGLLRPLSVLSGGPGTGKTHTVVSLLVAHVLLAEARGGPTPRMAIAAPTGKAAARLEQAISEAVTARALPDDAIAVVATLRGRTIHRLLGYQRHAPTRFRHDADNPLPHDVVVIDEASMVPLSLMTKLVEAVRRDATLVLVGDRNQLTSVEAGAVLGDICGPQPTGSSLRLSDEWSQVLEEATGAPVGQERDPMPREGVWDGIVQLERFRRFGPDTGIGAVARAIQAIPDEGAAATIAAATTAATDHADDTDHAAAQSVIDHLTGAAVEDGAEVDVYTDVELLQPEPGSPLPRALRPVVTAAFQPYIEAVSAGDAAGALAAIDALRVLCAVREGPYGVREVGALVERWMAAAYDVLDTSEEWYEGRPVLVTRNDHDLGVMNGDVGVTLDHDGRKVVAFQLADGEIKQVPAIRVADCETVWAMTIHKSQGSQFDHAIVVLPDRDTEVVTRELVYTGVTRAQQRVMIVAAEPRLRASVLRPVRRATGLRERLWA